MSNNTNTNTTKLVELGAMWKKKSAKSGQSYLSGVINLKSLGFEDKNVQVLVFSNKDKKEGQPDYRVYQSRPLEKTATSAKTVAKQDKKVEPAPAPVEPDEELI